MRSSSSLIVERPVGVLAKPDTHLTAFGPPECAQVPRHYVITMYTYDAMIPDVDHPTENSTSQTRHADGVLSLLVFQQASILITESRRHALEERNHF